VHRPVRLISAGGESLELAELHGRAIAAFCGIGNPAGFRHTLAQCGLNIAGWLELADHCAYDEGELAHMHEWLRPLDVEHVVCTRKDLVKIPRDELAGKRLWALEIELEIVRGREALDELLERLAADYQSQSESSSRGRL
jgi:tetraacyldisaccharide 4'-kinase